MVNQRKCTKCGKEMIKGTSTGNFSVNITNKIQGGETSKYMCTNCGYIEEYVDDISFIYKRE